MEAAPETFRIREIVPEEHRDDVLDLLQRNLPQHQGRRQFEWTYASHPDGRARAWVLTSGSRMLGFAAAFPRRLEGGEAGGWLLGDFVVERNVRALGPAVRLQRHLLEDLGRDPQALVVDFPSRTMLGIYRWLKLEPNERFERWVLPLRSSPGTPRGGGGTGAGRSALMSLAGLWFRLRLRGWSPGTGRRFLSSDEEVSGASFRALLDEVPGWGYQRCARSPEHLRWMLARPMGPPPKVATIRQNGSVVGAVVYQPSDDGWAVLDHLEDPHVPPRRSVLAGVCAAAAAAGARKVVTHVTSSSPMAHVLKRLGFRMRDATPSLVYRRAGGKWDALDVCAAGFHWMQGDRDA